MAFIISMSVLSLLFVPKIITFLRATGDTPVGTTYKRSQMSSTMNDLMITNLKAKVENLEGLLQKAGESMDHSTFRKLLLMISYLHQ